MQSFEQFAVSYAKKELEASKVEKSKLSLISN